MGLCLLSYGVNLFIFSMGSLLALVLAYLVRFIAVAYGPLENSLSRIRPSLPEAARSLAESGR